MRLSGGPRFDGVVPPGGYAWWYIDALSDDGNFALTVIAFIGSVFSPWYRLARRRGAARAENHVCLHATIAGPGARAWAMCERGAGTLSRAETTLAIGRSRLDWPGDALTIDIDEPTAPFPGRIEGRVIIRPQALATHVEHLDAQGRHAWSPIAPSSRAEVTLTRPACRWTGHAYLDSNWGSRPLEDDFSRWTWSRAPLGSETIVFYDVVRRDATAQAIALRYRASGDAEPVSPLPVHTLKPTLWRIPRETRADAGATPTARTTLDAPFYARSVLATQLFGQPAAAMHEALSLRRFTAPATQLMLPFKAPRLPLLRRRT